MSSGMDMAVAIDCRGQFLGILMIRIAVFWELY